MSGVKLTSIALLLFIVLPLLFSPLILFPLCMCIVTLILLHPRLLEHSFKFIVSEQSAIQTCEYIRVKIPGLLFFFHGGAVNRDVVESSIGQLMDNFASHFESLVKYKELISLYGLVTCLYLVYLFVLFCSSVLYQFREKYI
jgi:hypothetical protein